MNPAKLKTSRRDFLGTMAAASTAATLAPLTVKAAAAKWQPRYIVGSSMYGYKPLAEILPEVRKTGSTAIDIWPKSHGNQREQLQEMGETLCVPAHRSLGLVAVNRTLRATTCQLASYPSLGATPPPRPGLVAGGAAGHHRKPARTTQRAAPASQDHHRPAQARADHGA